MNPLYITGKSLRHLRMILAIQDGRAVTDTICQNHSRVTITTITAGNKNIQYAFPVIIFISDKYNVCFCIVTILNILIVNMIHLWPLPTSILCSCISVQICPPNLEVLVSHFYFCTVLEGKLYKLLQQVDEEDIKTLLHINSTEWTAGGHWASISLW